MMQKYTIVGNGLLPVIDGAPFNPILYLTDEVDAEISKKNEEIARLKVRMEAILKLAEDAKNHIIILAREALAEKE